MAEDDQFPLEISENIIKFHDSLIDLEGSLNNIMLIDNLDEQLDKTTKAAHDLSIAYTLNSLFWTYLQTAGVSPQNHNIKSEIKRVKEAMNRLTEITEKPNLSRLDVAASKRLILGNLPEIRKKLKEAST